MSKLKERRYKEHEKIDKSMDDDKDFSDFGTEFDDEIDDPMVSDLEQFNFKHTRRDIEKYKEMQELSKIINDELFTGICDEEFFYNEQYE